MLLLALNQWMPEWFTVVAEPHSTTLRCGPWWFYLIKTISDWIKQDYTWLTRGQCTRTWPSWRHVYALTSRCALCHVSIESFFLIGLALHKKMRANELAECVNLAEIMDFKQEIREIRDFSYGQVELKRENEYIPIFKYILSFKDSSS